MEHVILVIEDDAATREAVKALLEMRGYKVVLTANGNDGLTKLRAGLRPCVILLDLTMPEKSGFEFRLEQVVDPELAQIPVIIYSGDAEAYARAADYGAAALLQKPVGIDVLVETIEAHC